MAVKNSILPWLRVGSRIRRVITHFFSHHICFDAILLADVIMFLNTTSTRQTFRTKRHMKMQPNDLKGISIGKGCLNIIDQIENIPLPLNVFDPFGTSSASGGGLTTWKQLTCYKIVANLIPSEKNVQPSEPQELWRKRRTLTLEETRERAKRPFKV